MPGRSAGEDSVLVRVLKCVSLDQVVAEQRAELARLSWWQLGERRSVRGLLDFSVGEAAAAWADLPAGAVDDVARQGIHDAWDRLRSNPGGQYHSRRHPFHREVLTGDMAGLCTATSKAAIARAAHTPLDARWLGVVPAQIPGYLERLTPAHVRDHAEAMVARYAAIADDDRLLVASHDFEGQPGLLVQHVASGLRARFWWDPATGVGIVYSKPYRLPSIDPDRPGTLETWASVTGLGIGARIYRHAASLQPGVRWSGGVQSDGARGLRRKLHAADPWRWEASCSWCATHVPWWEKATRADFTNHPS